MHNTTNPVSKCLLFSMMAFLGCTEIPDEPPRCGIWGQTYNSSTHFCSGNDVYDKCNGLEYNPETEFCSGNSVYGKCGDSKYTPATENCCGSNTYTLATSFCSGTSAYYKCGGLEYNPETQGCQSSVVKSRCGRSSNYYNPETEFCSGNSVYGKCDGLEYDPETQRCESNVVKSRCGTSSNYFSNYYNPETEFCSGNSVYGKCDGLEYDPETQRCESSVVKSKCGTSSNYYNPETEFCGGNSVYSKCGGKEYNPLYQRCQSGVLEYKCGSNWYNLNPETQYCSNGTTVANYGSVSYEGKSYKTVVISTQTWMSENLNHNANASKCYDNQDSNCDKYGRLYNWATAMALPSKCNSKLSTTDVDCAIATPHRGVCPVGWHIPSDVDWNVLMKAANTSCSNNSSCDNAGTKLKATSDWNSYNGIPVSTGEFGFAALPGGGGFSDGDFQNVGNYGYWWSTLENIANNAYDRSMGYDYAYAYWGSHDKSYLFSVRCVKD
jgi:uncharacterized protein (TIGR02145 family)